MVKIYFKKNPLSLILNSTPSADVFEPLELSLSMTDENVQLFKMGNSMYTLLKLSEGFKNKFNIYNSEYLLSYTNSEFEKSVLYHISNNNAYRDTIIDFKILPHIFLTFEEKYSGRYTMPRIVEFLKSEMEDLFQNLFDNSN